MTTHEADVSFTGTTTLTPYPAQPVPVDLRGHYRFAARRLSADLALTTGLLKNLPLQLVYDTESASGTLTAKHDLSWQTPLIAGILPGWQTPFDFDRGSLALRLNLRLAEAIDGTAILSLTDTALRYGNYLANRTSAAISANLGPEGLNLGPSTLTIGSIDVGFPLTDIRAGLSGGADALHISDLSARLLGGLASAAPFDYRIDTATADLDLSLSDLDLAQVLALEGTDITGSGRLDGLLPIRVRGGEASVSGGRIEARAPGGRIQLAPSLANAITQPGLDIALKALEDFEFTALRATADYGTTGDLELGLRLEGRNARIEGGRPIHYNLNISENIPTLLESLRLSDTFTRSIERRALQ